MRILILHNYYGHYALGGEGNVFETEAAYLKDHGHEVRKFSCTNSEIMNAGITDKIAAFFRAPWSMPSYRAVRKEINRFKPDIMHVHNFFFMLSPSVFRAARDTAVPTVATLHNYRFISPCSQLLRNGKICEKCVNKNPLPILWHRCYHNSFLASLLRYRVYYSSQKSKHWLDDINSFVALTEFGRQKFIDAGFSAESIFVKPNCVGDPLTDEPTPPGLGALFVGRLSREKGLGHLITAWQKINYPLTIIGDGPLYSELKTNNKNLNITFLGSLDREKVFDYIKKSAFLITPSIWYEPFGLVNIEAMAMARPVIGSRLAALPQIIDENKTGLLFTPADPMDLARKVRFMIENPKAVTRMGLAAREAYLKRYTIKRNYELLLNIYETTISKYRVGPGAMPTLAWACRT